jgi:hypothetical protein
MAENLAEIVLMKYFFPGIDLKDRWRTNKLKSDFMNDMQFNLTNGTVRNTSLRFLQNKVSASPYF